MNAESKALIRNIRRQEIEQRAKRLANIQRALKRHNKKLLDFEITNIEQAIYPALGRIEAARH